MLRATLIKSGPFGPHAARKRADMKLLSACLLIAGAILVWRLTAEIATNRELRGEVRQIKSQLADSSKAESLQLQQKCAEQAMTLFHALGYKDSHLNFNSDLYQSHYNPKLGKCFVEITSTDLSTSPGTEAINRVLFDAVERRVYAEYGWMSSKTKKYWEVPPWNCRLTPSSANEQPCKSEDEYKAFVAKYIE